MFVVAESGLFIPPDEFLTNGRGRQEVIPLPQLVESSQSLHREALYPGASPLLIEKGVFPLDPREPKDQTETSFIPQLWRLGAVALNDGKKVDITGYVVGIVRTDRKDDVEAAFYIDDLYDEPMQKFTQERVIGIWGTPETVVRVTFTKQEADQINFSHINPPASQEVTLFSRAA